jgi:GNAT superfamily N-acetyltransferase
MVSAVSAGLTPISYCELVKAFPKWWLSGTMTPTQVEELCGDIGPAAVRTQAAMGIGWPSHRLRRFIVRSTAAANHSEWWEVPAGSWRMVMYSADATSVSAPCGCIVFRPSMNAAVLDRRICEFELRIDLVWVHPTLRRQGYAKHLAAHLVRYFDHHPVAGARRPLVRDGISARVVAESDLEACRRVVHYIHEYFELQREMFMIEEAGKPRGWPIRSTNFVPE